MTLFASTHFIIRTIIFPLVSVFREKRLLKFQSFLIDAIRHPYQNYRWYLIIYLSVHFCPVISYNFSSSVSTHTKWSVFPPHYKTQFPNPSVLMATIVVNQSKLMNFHLNYCKRGTKNETKFRYNSKISSFCKNYLTCPSRFSRNSLLYTQLVKFSREYVRRLTGHIVVFNRYISKQSYFIPSTYRDMGRGEKKRKRDRCKYV